MDILDHRNSCRQRFPVNRRGPYRIQIMTEQTIRPEALNPISQGAGRVLIAKHLPNLPQLARTIGAIPVLAVPPESIHLKLFPSMPENSLRRLLLSAAMPVAIE